MSNLNKADDEKVTDVDGMTALTVRGSVEWLRRMDTGATMNARSRNDEIVANSSTGHLFMESFDNIICRVARYAVENGGITIQQAIADLAKRSLDQIAETQEASRRKGIRT